MENRNKSDLKRKRLDDGTEQEQEPAIKETCQVLKEMESEVQNLRDDNNLLRDELLGKDRQLAETDTLLVDREHQLSKSQTLLVDSESWSNLEFFLTLVVCQHKICIYGD
ncbi:uncharacterized protein LOC119318636 [Triticum dicoccoides]|uniref:uncharacterized protein LOC119318636 n=1 Tax=Triticum dicoccoides TaxID=85692 RepID=UPI00189130B4|nr:uncharacterized protein LOC119318636 [Triticum dicoccoides]